MFLKLSPEYLSICYILSLFCIFYAFYNTFKRQTISLILSPKLINTHMHYPLNWSVILDTSLQEQLTRLSIQTSLNLRIYYLIFYHLFIYVFIKQLKTYLKGPLVVSTRMLVDDREGNRNLPIYYGNLDCRGRDRSIKTQVEWLADAVIEGPRQETKANDVNLKV